MAIKKSDLYSTLWKSCDELRGGMDASQYKDYVLTILFIKYVSDKYYGKENALVEVPKGSSFQDLINLKKKDDIGDMINKKILRPIAEANDLDNLIKIDFNDDAKLGKGKEMVDRLSKLIGVFEDPRLDFSKNKAEGDDILGDAYEYLMKNFATESGKSKGQFYTPSEVSRIMAQVIGISNATRQDQTIYDPTCGSASLLLKAIDESKVKVTVYGQEMDNTTAGLAKMNMYLHGIPDAEVIGGVSTISTPFFKDEKDNTKLKRFDYIVANPPFSSKNWTSGFDPENDEFERFEGFGIPPSKNGDYAFLLHIIKSLKSTGKGAIILPHGVLFRGNAEAEIRKSIIKKGYIKGIIGLPANLFFGTGIPACIIVLDKENAQSRKGIFMIDASKGFMKDGNKNRLRFQDIHKIVDVFNKGIEIPKYSRLVPMSEISDEKKNNYNLNIPRYIDTQEEEDIQNIEAHLMGGIPKKDIEAMDKYWKIFSNLRKELFKNTTRDGFYNINVDVEDIKNKILEDKEFIDYKKEVFDKFCKWNNKYLEELKKLEIGIKPKKIIDGMSEELLQTFSNVPLIDRYDMYQHLLTYWSDVMQDDLYMISQIGFKAEVYRILEKNNKGKEVDKGWTCDLIPKDLVVNRYFVNERDAIKELQNELENASSEMESLKEENSGDEGLLVEVINDKGNISLQSVKSRIKNLIKEGDNEEELNVLNQYQSLLEKEKDLKKEFKLAEESLDNKLLKKYSELKEDEIKVLVVEDKWLKSIESAVKEELNNISQRLTQRIKELAKRYENTLPELQTKAKELEESVEKHLAKMGFKI